MLNKFYKFETYPIRHVVLYCCLPEKECTLETYQAVLFESGKGMVGLVPKNAEKMILQITDKILPYCVFCKKTMFTGEQLSMLKTIIKLSGVEICTEFLKILGWEAI